MTATTAEATATRQLVELEDRIGQLQHTREALAGQRAEAERQLARATADGAPEAQRRQLSGAVEQLDREAVGYAGAVALLEADLPALQEAAQAERQAVAEARADQMQAAFTASVHATVEALQRVAREYLEQHRRMLAARSAAVEARRAALRLSGAAAQDVFHAEPAEPRLGDDGDFAALGRLLARYAAGLE